MLELLFEEMKLVYDDISRHFDGHMFLTKETYIAIQKKAIRKIKQDNPELCEIFKNH